MKNILQEEHSRLNGTWVQTYLSEDGVDDIEDETYRSVTEFNNGEFKVYSSEGKVLLKGTYEIKSTIVPFGIDWSDSTGDDEGKMFQSIYTLEDDTFKFCAADEGMPRPISIESKKGYTIRQFSRVKENA